MAKSKQTVYAEHMKNMENPELMHANRKGSAMASWESVDPNVLTRPEYTRSTYESFRCDEQVVNPKTQSDYQKIMMQCKIAYERVGIVRSVVDMMSEFAAEGIEIVHQDAGANAFYKEWSQIVNLEDRVERFLSWFYKAGQAVVRRRMAKIKKADIINMRRSAGLDDLIIDDNANTTIPIQFTFYDPSTIDVIGGGAAGLSSNKEYAMKISTVIADAIRNPKDPAEKKVIEGLPAEIKELLNGAIKTSSGKYYYIKIPNDRIFVAYYKKDDSDMWAKSFIYSILPDIFFNDKLRLAKTAGLDGFYNMVRVWKLGDHKIGAYPSPGVMAKLGGVLEHNSGGGALDLIWDSMIEVQELYPPLEQLVNFEENVETILLGLGVPKSLVGGTEETGNANVLGLRNMIKRLEAGRRAVIEWLNAEIDIIQKVMGFRHRPHIRFQNADLHDERTYFNLLLQLVDRNILSDETVLERIDEIPEIEEMRIKREKELKEKKELPPKASPYHNPLIEDQRKFELKKEQMRLDNSNNQSKQKQQGKKKKGRPSGSPDKVKRKRSPNKLRKSSAEFLMFAQDICESVDNFVASEIVPTYGVNDVRQLSSAQKIEIEDYKKSIMSIIPLDIDKIDKGKILDCINNRDNYNIAANMFDKIYKDSLPSTGESTLTASQKRMLRIHAYASTHYKLLNYSN